LRISRRNNNIQKDFFSMAEYLIWGVNQVYEMEYYNKKRSRKQGRVIAMFD
jgi:hypothetical protein